MSVQSLEDWGQRDDRRQPTQARLWLEAAEELLAEVGSTVTGVIEGALCEAHARRRHPASIDPRLADDIDGRR